MTNPVVRLSLLGVLLAAIATPALAHRGNLVLSTQKPTTLSISAAALPGFIADGNPIPWPDSKTPNKPPAKAADPTKLIADELPIPWPNIQTPETDGTGRDLKRQLRRNLPRTIGGGAVVSLCFSPASALWRTFLRR